MRKIIVRIIIKIRMTRMIMIIIKNTLIIKHINDNGTDHDR